MIATLIALPESSQTTVLLIFWITGVAMAMYKTEDVRADHSITWSLFASAWGCFVLPLLLLISGCRTKMKRENDPLWYHWVIFSIASLVTMSSASIHWNRRDCSDYYYDDEWYDECYDEYYDKLLGIILGSVSSIAGATLSVYSTTDNESKKHFVRLIVPVVLFASWSFGISSPVVYPSPLYFGVFTCWIISLCTSVVGVYDLAKETNLDHGTPATGSIPPKPETLDAKADEDDKMEQGRALDSTHPTKDHVDMEARDRSRRNLHNEHHQRTHQRHQKTNPRLVEPHHKGKSERDHSPRHPQDVKHKEKPQRKPLVDSSDEEEIGP